ncbi:MAG: hypothetical protein ABSF48_18460, partial [Thermodesulfobacteriota bacterium]
DGKKCSLEFVSPAEAGVQSVGFKGRPSSRRCLSYYGLPSIFFLPAFEKRSIKAAYQDEPRGIRYSLGDACHETGEHDLGS